MNLNLIKDFPAFNLPWIYRRSLLNEVFILFLNNVTLSGKSSLILRENKTAFCREGHIIQKVKLNTFVLNLHCLLIRMSILPIYVLKNLVFNLINCIIIYIEGVYHVLCKFVSKYVCMYACILLIIWLI